MKVAVIAHSYIYSTYIKTLDELAGFMEVDLITPSIWEGRKVSYKPHGNLHLHFLDRYFSGKLHISLYKPGLHALIKKISPGVAFVSEEPYSLVSYQCMKVLREFKIPAVFFTWQNIYKRFPPPFSIFEKFVFKYSAGIVAGSNLAKDVLLLKGYNKPVEVIPNHGIDIEHFKRDNSQKLKAELKLNNRIIIGYVGRLVKEKGILILLEAFRDINIENPSTLLLIIGDGPLKGYLRKLVNAWKLTDSVIFFDFIEQDILPLYYSIMDVFVLPSTHYIGRIFFWKGWKEQFGMVLIEAMACGVPVVASDSGSIPEVIQDAGLIFRENDAGDLKQKLLLIIKDQDLRNELVEKGYRRCIEFSSHEVAKKLYVFLKYIYEASN